MQYYLTVVACVLVQALASLAAACTHIPHLYVRLCAITLYACVLVQALASQALAAAQQVSSLKQRVAQLQEANEALEGVTHSMTAK